MHADQLRWICMNLFMCVCVCVCVCVCLYGQKRVPSFTNISVILGYDVYCCKWAVVVCKCVHRTVVHTTTETHTISHYVTKTAFFLMQLQVNNEKDGDWRRMEKQHVTHLSVSGKQHENNLQVH